MPLLALLPAAVPELATLLLLAVVQGVSEFLPISSDGHLVLAQSALGLEGRHLALDVALHLGTLVAVLVVFRRDVRAVAARALAGDAREAGLIALATLPAGLVLFVRPEVEALFASSRAAATGLFVTAAFLLAGEGARRRNAPARVLGWRDALWIGLAQALAPLPGVSRSGTTIATALLRGIEADAAARFSFLLSIPAVSAAVLLEVPALARGGGFGFDLLLAIGASFAVGLLALRVLLRFLGRGAFRWCAFYCLALGSVAWVAL